MNDSFKNPFSGINASAMDDKSILEYWCNPFNYEVFSEINEEDVYQEDSNIVFLGGRATGKSMFLRYWSYPVQLLAAELEGVNFGAKIAQNRGIGFYFRIDGSTLRSFSGYGLSEEHWTALFVHYFELTVARDYLDAISLLHREHSISATEIEDVLLPNLQDLLGDSSGKSLDAVAALIDRRLEHVNRYRGDVPFSRSPFVPDGKVFPAKSLSFGLARTMQKSLAVFRDLNFILLLDEYENFLTYQQVSINSILKFTEPHIKFRIGMRLNGFRTFSVMNPDDYLKEGREYRSVVLEEVLNRSDLYENYLADIARKRLEAVPQLHELGHTDIRKILTSKEDLEDEARALVRRNRPRAREYFHSTFKIPKDDLETVRIDENPLMELLNCIWLLRGRTAQETRRAMEEFLAKEKTDAAKKYRNDYVNKYKLSLMFLLCSIYKRRKKYYSFNTFVFLSSGIVGHFMELCRSSFAVAGWGENDRLLSVGEIGRDDQDTAAVEVSTISIRQVNRIENHGSELSVFVENLGNIFREFHLDFGIRYPETNQFAMKIDAILDAKTKAVVEAALKWSVIMQKPRMQRSSPSDSSLQELYFLNRIFSPVFQISYRTRGGWSLPLEEADITSLISAKLKTYTKYLPKPIVASMTPSVAVPLFPIDD